MRFLRPFLYLLLALVGAFLIFLIFSTIDDYDPEAEELLFSNDQPTMLPDSAILNLLIWNVGYAGLDAFMDNFRENCVG